MCPEDMDVPKQFTQNTELTLTHTSVSFFQHLKFYATQTLDNGQSYNGKSTSPILNW